MENDCSSAVSEHAVLPITGYLDRLSARPSEGIGAQISVRSAGRYRVRLCRVISADANPKGPGMRFEDLSPRFDQWFEGRTQPIVRGSWAQAPGPAIDQRGAHCWTALVLPSSDRKECRTVLHHAGAAVTLALGVGRAGVELALQSNGARYALTAAGSLRPHHWYRIWASLDPASGRVAVGFAAPPHLYASEESAVATGTVDGLLAPSGGTLLLAASEPGKAGTHFNGKIEDPAICSGYRSEWPAPLASIGEFGDSLQAGWDFSIGIGTQILSPVGPKGVAGALFNLPKRAVTGARWHGREQCWRHAPDEYAAIRFHDDDLGDCRWTTDFRFTVPADLPSGAYALHLSCTEGQDWLPFYVLPPRAGPHAAIAFLAPTFTYQAYGNHARGNSDEAYEARVKSWGAYPFNPDDYPIYGPSTYNRHSDGSGVAFSSRLRPLLTMRPGFMTFCEAGEGSGLRHYPADTHLLAWLEALGFDFDVVTDEDLHQEGASLLAPYSVVLTGSHPEYHTARTLDGLQQYVRAGGRLVYLGGNGFYWRIGRDDAHPAVIELRRAEGGVRAWAAEPGEYYHATDGQYGGLWRRNGRDPQQLVGVGFSAQGLFEATYYRRTTESYDPSCSWVFAGIEGEVIGDYGLNAGGAAGFEWDRADPTLGTPAGATVLARSENTPASFFPVMEELLVPSISVDGRPSQALVHADMVIFETPAGGAVFSVGSITFCGSLWRNGFEGPVSRLLQNVLNHFSNRRTATGSV
jgi:N,N-dimethylformamidase